MNVRESVNYYFHNNKKTNFIGSASKGSFISLWLLTQKNKLSNS